MIPFDISKDNTVCKIFDILLPIYHASFELGVQHFVIFIRLSHALNVSSMQSRDWFKNWQTGDKGKWFHLYSIILLKDSL